MIKVKVINKLKMDHKYKEEIFSIKNKKEVLIDKYIEVNQIK
jgi:hypothetical protein